MPIPSTALGTSSPPVTMTVERGRLQLFAKATGQTDPVYLEPEAAMAHGHRDLPVPPTFLFAVELEAPEPFGWLTSLGVDMNNVLHGTQGFTYERMAYAGDRLTAQSTITDLYSKKGGTLDFVERRTHITREGDLIASLEQVVIVREPEGRAA